MFSFHYVSAAMLWGLHYCFTGSSLSTFTIVFFCYFHQKAVQGQKYIILWWDEANASCLWAQFGTKCLVLPHCLHLVHVCTLWHDCKAYDKAETSKKKQNVFIMRKTSNDKFRQPLLCTINWCSKNIVLCEFVLIKKLITW